MISTAGTVETAVQALLAHGAVADITVAATPRPARGRRLGRLRRLPIRRLLVTDTLPMEPAGTLPLQVCSVAPLLADAIGLLHGNDA